MNKKIIDFNINKCENDLKEYGYIINNFKITWTEYKFIDLKIRITFNKRFDKNILLEIVSLNSIIKKDFRTLEEIKVYLNEGEFYGL